MAARYVIYLDDADEYRWRYVARNGETISVSSESYKDKRDALTSIHLVGGDDPTLDDQT